MYQAAITGKLTPLTAALNPLPYMAIELGSQTVTLTSERRTWRTTIESPIGVSPHLTSHRELVQKVGSDIISQKQVGTVNRSLSSVAHQEVTLSDGKVVTPAMIAEALVALIEKWEAEDTPAPVPAPEPAPDQAQAG